MDTHKHSLFTKFLMGILVFLMIAGVAVWGINDILIGSNNKTIAKVGNSKVSSFELENAVQNNKMQLMNAGISNFTDEMTSILRNNALVNIIGDRLLQNEFRNLNLQIDEKEVLKRDYLSQPDFTKEKLKAIAHSYGGEAAFLSKISKEKKIDFLQGSISAIEPTTNGIVKGVYNFENQTRNIEYIELGVENVSEKITSTDQDLKDFYEKNKENFISPEYRSISYIVLDKNIVKEGKDIAEKLHDISNNALDKVSGGATLEEIAKEYNLEIKKISALDNSGQFEDGNSVTNLPKVKDFIAAVFATEQGEISDLLESDNGDVYSFARVDEIKEKRIKTLDEVKNLAIIGLNTQKRAEKLIEISKQLKEDLDSGKTNLNEAASKNSVSVQQKQNIGTKDKQFSPEFTNDVFATEVGKFSNINKTNNNKIIIAKVTSVNSPNKPEELGLYEYKVKVKEQMSQEIMAQYLDYLKQKYSVSVYSK